jgi:ankyrin repeat protein
MDGGDSVPEPLTPQDLLMEGACAESPDEGKRLIDEALARGANFIDDDVEPLFYAAFKHQAEILAHLIARGATMAGEWPNNSRASPDGDRGATALHEAAEHGDLACLRVLLAADGVAFLEHFDLIGGRTPLIVAAERGHVEAVRLLIGAGANVDTHDDLMIGDTAIKRAVEERHLEIVRILLEAGADPTIPGWMRLSALDKARDGGEETREMLNLILVSLPRS